MNWYFVFYLFSVADKLGSTFGFLGTCFFFLSIVAVIAFCASHLGSDSDWTDNRQEEGKEKRLAFRTTARRAVFIFMPLCALLYLFEGLIPTKKDMLFIIIGGTVTNFATTNKNAQALPNDLLAWIRAEVKNQTAQVAPEQLQKLREAEVEAKKQEVKAETSDELAEAEALIRKGLEIKEQLQKQPKKE